MRAELHTGLSAPQGYYPPPLATDAIDILVADHRRIGQIVQQLRVSAEIRNREEMFTRLKQELMLHQMLEEDLLYPQLKERPETRELALESYEEHALVEGMLGDLDGLPASHES